MIEEVTKNTARNITNGILLQVCDLQKVEKSEKNRDKEKQQPSTFEKMTKQGENKNQPNAVTMFASEFIGTALLMFLGCMGCFPQVDKPQAFHHLSSLSFGLVVMLIIQGFGHISGAHLNPAVTFAAVILKFVTPMMSLVYVVAQFLGAIVGFGLLKILTPAEYFTDKFCMTLPHEYMSPMQALALETVITTTLIIVVCAVWDKRNEDKQDSTPLRFGLIVACISMVAGPFTGASMNTARTLAPALILGNYQYQWVYWIGPNIGAILGVGIYKFLFALKEEEEHTPDETMNLQDVKLEKS